MSDRFMYLLALIAAGGMFDAAMNGASAQPCAAMRKINIGVSVAPPNVVHTSPYVAKELGFFAKRCMEPNIIQFEGGQSATSIAAGGPGGGIVAGRGGGVGRGPEVAPVWG